MNFGSWGRTSDYRENYGSKFDFHLGLFFKTYKINNLKFDVFLVKRRSARATSHGDSVTSPNISQGH